MRILADRHAISDVSHSDLFYCYAPLYYDGSSDECELVIMGSAMVNILAKNPYFFPPPAFSLSRGFPVFRGLIFTEIWEIYKVRREAPKIWRFSM